MDVGGETGGGDLSKYPPSRTQIPCPTRVTTTRIVAKAKRQSNQISK